MLDCLQVTEVHGSRGSTDGQPRKGRRRLSNGVRRRFQRAATDRHQGLPPVTTALVASNDEYFAPVLHAENIHCHLLFMVLKANGCCLHGWTHTPVFGSCKFLLPSPLQLEAFKLATPSTFGDNHRAYAACLTSATRGGTRLDTTNEASPRIGRERAPDIIVAQEAGRI